MKFTKKGVDQSVDRLLTASGYDVTIKLYVIERVKCATNAVNVLLDVFCSHYTVISAVS